MECNSNELNRLSAPNSWRSGEKTEPPQLILIDKHIKSKKRQTLQSKQSIFAFAFSHAFPPECTKSNCFVPMNVNLSNLIEWFRFWANQSDLKCWNLRFKQHSSCFFPSLLPFAAVQSKVRQISDVDCMFLNVEILFHSSIHSLSMRHEFLTLNT